MDVRFLFIFIFIFIFGLSLNLLLEIKAENIFFSTATQIEHLQPVLDSEPAPTTLKLKKYTTILSQPLQHSFKWNDKKKVVVDWPIYLDNLGHCKTSHFFWALVALKFISPFDSPAVELQTGKK